MKAGFVFAITLLLGTILVPAGEVISPVPAALAGLWVGTAKMYVQGYEGISFPVAITIHRDGSVTGKVGDALLVNAQFARHRPKKLGRRESTLMDYMIHCDVAGPIVKAANFTAGSIFIPLDFIDGKFDSAVNTHDSAVAGVPTGTMCSSVLLTKK